MNLNTLKIRLSAILRQYKKYSGGTGVIERVTCEEAFGWFVTKTSERPQICTINHRGVDFDGYISWHYREDIAEDYFAWEQNCGFTVRFPPQLSKTFDQSIDFSKKVSIKIDGILLNSKPIRQKKIKRRSSHAIKVNKKGNVVIDGSSYQLALHSINSFILYAYIDSRLDLKSLQLNVNGQHIDCMFFKGVDEYDLASPKLPEKKGFTEYTIELPGAIWKQRSDITKPLRLSLIMNECETSFEPIYLNISDCRRWTKELIRGCFRQNSYCSVLILEHIYYLKDLESLDLTADEREELSELANEYNIQELNSSGNNLPEENILRAEGSSRLKLALLEFNEKSDCADEKISWMRGQHNTCSFDRQFMLDLYRHLIPYFCSKGLYAEIHNLLVEKSVFSESQIAALNRSDLSLALPYLAHEGRCEELTNVVTTIKNGREWFSSSCLKYSVELLLANNFVLADHKKKLCRETLLVYNSIGNEYWSRIQDVELINLYHTLIAKSHLYPAPLRKWILSFLDLNYALSPVFWEKYEESESIEHGIHKQFLNFVKISKLICNLSTVNSDDVIEAITLLDSLIEVGSSDAEQFRRELVNFYQKQFGSCYEPSIEQLASCYYSEKDHILPSESYTRIFPGTDNSEHYQLQIKARGLIRDNKEDELIELCSNLTSQEGEYLGLDILASYLFTCEEKAFLKGYNLYLYLLKKVCPAIQNMIHSPAPVQASFGKIKNCLLKFKRIEQLEELENIRKSLQRNPITSASQNNDAIVLIYSCQKNLGTRIKSIRKSWLKELQEKDIPYLIVVGGGSENKVVKDVLYLNAADNYEGLPEKTLAMISWVYSNTDHQYMIKIDDDCSLNVDEYFTSLSYRKFHYYGRKLKRAPGNMDRLWHHEKSESSYAKFSFDKSPEPACYADGGTGYSISRYAAYKLGKMSATREGCRLISSSFFEDKLVGDLLAMAQIALSDEDYFVHILRKLTSDGSPVSRWGNHHYPSLNSPAKLVHTDSGELFDSVLQYRSKSGLYPSKIFPSYTQASYGYNAIQLELLSDQKHIEKLLNEYVYIVSVLYNELTILPSFLTHYRNLGVKTFLLVDNLSTDGTREFLLQQPDVVLYSAATEYKDSHYGVDWQQALLACHCLNKWALVVDADEFIVFPDMESRNISDYIEELDHQGADSALLYMIDMYPYGNLSEANFEREAPFVCAPYFDRQPVKRIATDAGYFGDSEASVSQLRHRLHPEARINAFVSQKVALLKYRPWMKLSEGLHYVSSTKPAQKPVALAHFKYHAGFKQKVDLEIKRKQHYNNATEYVIYQEILSESKGTFGSRDASVKYKSSNQFLDEAFEKL
jgi:hypothetical protein